MQNQSPMSSDLKVRLGPRIGRGCIELNWGRDSVPFFLIFSPFFPLNLYWGEPKCLQPFAMKIDGDTEISNKLFTQRGSEALIEKFF